MTHLRELLASDLSKVPEEELVAGVREAELMFDEAQRWGGQLVAELRRRADPPSSWAELAKLTGLAPTTLRNRVAKHEEGTTA